VLDGAEGGGPGCCARAATTKTHVITMPKGNLRNMKGYSSGIVTPEGRSD